MKHKEIGVDISHALNSHRCAADSHHLKQHLVLFVELGFKRLHHALDLLVSPTCEIWVFHQFVKPIPVHRAVKNKVFHIIPRLPRLWDRRGLFLF